LLVERHKSAFMRPTDAKVSPWKGEAAYFNFCPFFIHSEEGYARVVSVYFWRFTAELVRT
jgi:hypothetical protein